MVITELTNRINILYGKALGLFCLDFWTSFCKLLQMNEQKQPSRGVLRKSCSENMQQIYRRTPMPKCDFNKVALHTLRHGCSPVNLLHIFRTPFSENTSGRLLLGISQVIMKIWARIWYSRIALKNSILQIHQIHLRLYSCLVLSHTASCIYRWYFIAIFKIFWLQSSGNLQNSYF